MKLVFIAGPFTASTTWEVEQNVRRAECVALEIAKIGAMPVCPHTNTRYFHGLITPEFWYEGTLELLRRCDAVYLLDNWRDSSGARNEFAEAQIMKKFIFDKFKNLERYVKSGIYIYELQ